MGQWYEIGLQAGKKVADAVDAFIAGENFEPEERKEMQDGTIVYRWYMKWNPHWYEDEKRFVKVLGTFDDIEAGNMTDEEYESIAYKLVAVGDDGGQDEMGNEAGYELFSELYNDFSIVFPDGFLDDEKRIDISTPIGTLVAKQNSDNPGISLFLLSKGETLDIATVEIQGDEFVVKPAA